MPLFAPVDSSLLQHWQVCVQAGQRCGAAVAGLLFPPCCAHCDVSMDTASVQPQLCEACVARLRSQNAHCRRCGRWFPGPAPQCCACHQRKWAFDAVWSLGPYAGTLRDAVRTTKQPAGASLAYALGTLLADRFWGDGCRESADLVTCVPKHWSKRLGTAADGPAALLAGFCRRTKLPAAADLLVCRRRIQKQAWLSPAQRQRNVRGAWGLRSSSAVRDRSIVLLDDTMTTGATVEAVARVLKSAGAARVLIAVAAKASKMQ